MWDEVEYLLRAERVGTWLRLVFDTTHPEGGFHAFSESVVLDHWRFISYSEGHPAWFAFPIALGQALLTGLVDPLAAARLGPITVSSLACGAVAFRLKTVYGTTGRSRGADRDPDVPEVVFLMPTSPRSTGS